MDDMTLLIKCYTKYNTCVEDRANRIFNTDSATFLYEKIIKKLLCESLKRIVLAMNRMVLGWAAGFWMEHL